MSKDVKLIDKLTGTILFECSIQDIDKAYIRAQEYEEMGLDIELKAPSIPETLIRALGANDQGVATLNKMLEEEISSHIEEESGCATCLPKE